MHQHICKQRKLFIRFLSLFVTVILAFSAQADANKLTSEDVQRLFKQTFDVMQEHYIDAEIVPELRSIFAHRFKLGMYKDIHSIKEFAEIIGRDIRTVSGDKHLSLYTIQPNEEATHILTHQPGRLTYNYAFEEVRYLSSNIGYLKFNKFHPSDKAKRVVDAAFVFLKQSEGLIIDLRDTVGGSPQLAQYIISYFLPKGTPLWEVQGAQGQLINTVKVNEKINNDAFQQDKPIWILTSRNTASASELFAGVMQANSRATIVGDFTAGAGFYVGVRHITDKLVFRISLSKPVISANQQNWEKVGITPDVKVPSLDAFDRALKLAQ